eukprot:4438724-Pyramimonas_sp.AAC.1
MALDSPSKEHKYTGSSGGGGAPATKIVDPQIPLCNRYFFRGPAPRARAQYGTHEMASKMALGSPRKERKYTG